MARLPTRKAFIANGLQLSSPPSDESECPICREEWGDVSAENAIVSTPHCHHIFHQVCLVSWFGEDDRLNDTCPSCRRVLFGGPGYDYQDSNDESGDRIYNLLRHLENFIDLPRVQRMLRHFLEHNTHVSRYIDALNCWIDVARAQFLRENSLPEAAMNYILTTAFIRGYGQEIPVEAFASLCVHRRSLLDQVTQATPTDDLRDLIRTLIESSGTLNYLISLRHELNISGNRQSAFSVRYTDHDGVPVSSLLRLQDSWVDALSPRLSVSRGFMVLRERGPGWLVSATIDHEHHAVRVEGVDGRVEYQWSVA